MDRAGPCRLIEVGPRERRYLTTDKNPRALAATLVALHRQYVDHGTTVVVEVHGRRGLGLYGDQSMVTEYTYRPGEALAWRGWLE